jgi:phospholipid/cholesterol/gamma-HCH transport system ATP-binding protein
MISVEHLSITLYDKNILSDISLNLEDRSVTAILGKNGAGKTVLLKAISGLIPFVSGKIIIDGVPAGRDLYAQRNAPLVSYVFQKGGLFDSMTVFDNVAFLLRRRGEEEDIIHTKVFTILSRVGLSGTEYRLPSELSGGMQKRVCLARAVSAGAAHILYDDPSAGLDPVLTDSIGELIAEISMNEKVTSLIVTHDLSLVKKVAENVILMHNGCIIYRGSVRNFFSCEDPIARQFIEGEKDGPIKADEEYL